MKYLSYIFLEFLFIVFPLMSQDVLFKKWIDTNSLIYVETKINRTITNLIVYTPKNSKQDTLEKTPGVEYTYSKASCYLINLPNKTNLLWERLYNSTDLRKRFLQSGIYGPDGKTSVPGLVPYSSIKIFDVYYNNTNNYFAILWAEDNKSVFCQLGISPPYPAKLFHKNQNIQTNTIILGDACCELKINGVPIGMKAISGNFLYDLKSDKFIAEIKTARNEMFQFEWLNNEWVQVK